jgi:hypothetical protein
VRWGGRGEREMGERDEGDFVVCLCNVVCDKYPL